LHPPTAIEVIEPRLVHHASLDESRKHLAMAAARALACWAFALGFGAKIGGLHVHVGVELRDAVFIAGVAAAVERGQ